jgi:hypothetical protein
MDDEKALIAGITALGLDARRGEPSWTEALPLLAALDAIGRDGGSAMVKIDGARANSDVFTVVVSGGRLGECFFRKDGSDLRSLLREAVAYYVKHAVHGGG